MKNTNPFVTSGYRSAEYFCDRKNETNFLTQRITNGNNVAIISPRRLGKTGLIEHCFSRKEIADNYFTFLIDIYATKNMQEFVYVFGKNILKFLKPKGRTIIEKFISALSSIKAEINFDANEMPNWSIGVSDIKNPSITLDEIFEYLELAEKQCIVAIDEFQAITKYPENNVEAIIRTHIQHSTNANFIFSGSQRHMMGEIFTTPTRPFYQSTSILELKPIAKEEYMKFIKFHFESNSKMIDDAVISKVYDDFEGITWYIQFMMNFLFASTDSNKICTEENITLALNEILSQMDFTYSSLLFQLPTKQKEILLAICNEGKAQAITSKRFLQQHHLTASAVQAAIKGLMDKDFVTMELGVYSIYDRFFELWLKQKQ